MLVMMSAQELSNGISYSGHIYAMTRAGRSLTPTADLYETFTGMDQVSYSCHLMYSERHGLSDIRFILKVLNCSYLSFTVFKDYLFKLFKYEPT